MIGVFISSEKSKIETVMCVLSQKSERIESEDVEVDVLLKTGKSTTLSIFCERAQKSLIWQSGNRAW